LGAGSLARAFLLRRRYNKPGLFSNIAMAEGGYENPADDPYDGPWEDDDDDTGPAVWKKG